MELANQIRKLGSSAGLSLTPLSCRTLFDAFTNDLDQDKPGHGVLWCFHCLLHTDCVTCYTLDAVMKKLISTHSVSVHDKMVGM